MLVFEYRLKRCLKIAGRTRTSREEAYQLLDHANCSLGRTCAESWRFELG